MEHYSLFKNPSCFVKTSVQRGSARGEAPARNWIIAIKNDRKTDLSVLSGFLTSAARFFVKIYFYKKCGVFEAYKKVSDFLYAEGLHGKHGAQMFSVFGYVYLADEKILARKYGFFKAAAVGAIALVLNDIERLVAFVAFSHAGNDIYHKLCVLEPCIPTTTGYISSTYLGMTSDSSPISRTISAPSLPAAISNADNARSYELIALLLNIFNALFALLCKLLCGKLLLKTHTHHDRAHIVVDDGLKNSILGILVGNTGIGHAFKADLRSQRKNIRSVCYCFSPYNFPPIFPL